ncbi:MAG: AAA family ATPase [Candidatus Methanoplasma sp.]|jgi:magnesium chelatase subunit I|nr:AAA family ATPase [Candidatus Methanoplasma sp.]
MKRRTAYPFSAIVGQERMKKALLLNAVHPSIGGVLIRGEKGTAKSTAVRALADLLPERHVVLGCPCGCRWGDPNNACADCADKYSMNAAEEALEPMRVVELPLSSTEDRVVGTLDIEHAISTGTKRFEPGILARANGNILYVDEVNLLEDHLVDLLLDAAAMGVNFVEREGVSFSHPSRFVLIGTMNPEEGDLRPQLLDRFGLVVDVESERGEERRIDIIRRLIDFENDPEEFARSYEKEQKELSDAIVKARFGLRRLHPGADILTLAARAAMHLGVDGHRSDITLIKAALANAALAGKDAADASDVLEVSGLVLPHRMRRTPFQDSELNTEEFNDWMTKEIDAL